jgi:peroxiredoxin
MFAITKSRNKLNPRVAINQLAPDLEVINSDGETINLSSVWQAKPVVLTFLRHFG